jgi:SCY1-like protein 2
VCPASVLCVVRVSVFVSDVLPLVYNALDSEHAAVRYLIILPEPILSCFEVQERALGVVPGLCESIDYAEVQGVLFPRVAVGLPICPTIISPTMMIARFYQNAHSVRESSHSRYILKHGQNARSGNAHVITRSRPGPRLTKAQTSLTQKLVPLLSKIRTKEPAVTVCFRWPSLSVQ